MLRVIMLIAVLLVAMPFWAQDDPGAAATEQNAKVETSGDQQFAEEAETELDEATVEDLEVDDEEERELVRKRLEEKREERVPSRNLLNQKTLLSGNIAHGFFGGPVVKGTYMDEEYELLVGGRLGYIINHRLCIGLGGYGMVTNHRVREHAIPDSTIQVYMGYGGLDLEYRINPQDLINYSVTTLIGAGGASLRYGDEDWDGEDDDWDDDDEDDHDGKHIDSDAFFVFEPGFNIMVNVAKYFKCGIGASYRYINGVDFDTNLVDVEDEDLSGLTLMLNFEGGFF